MRVRACGVYELMCTCVLVIWRILQVPASLHQTCTAYVDCQVVCAFFSSSGSACLDNGGEGTQALAWPARLLLVTSVRVCMRKGLFGLCSPALATSRTNKHHCLFSYPSLDVQWMPARSPDTPAHGLVRITA